MQNVKLICFASKNIQELTGQGLEYLLDAEENVIAVFSEGNIVRQYAGNKANSDSNTAIVVEVQIAA